MNSTSDLRFSKNMKYIALYSSMHFIEISEDKYQKQYCDGTKITILADKQEVLINNNFSFFLKTHSSFVKLECLNRILELGFDIEKITCISDDNFCFFRGFKIIFYDWHTDFDLNKLQKSEVFYKSRLISGVIEYKSKIKTDDIFDYGLFEKKEDKISLKKAAKNHYKNDNFEIEENRIIKYLGKEKKVIVPEGITELGPCSFWDNKYIEEVILPDSLENYGGDTFYNCQNLRKVNIPSNVKVMGDNPFAGCPLVEITNLSNNFIYDKGLLFTSDKKTLIYCSIKGDESELVIPEGTLLIGKHAFFLCKRFEKIVIPSSAIKMKNNPFSGCNKLNLINHSSHYNVENNVIYNQYWTSVVGCLSSIKIDELIIKKGVKTINRNSFWNCVGIKKIVFPSTLEEIGYNPFIGCSNIHFVSESDKFKVVDGMLFNSDLSVLICCPKWRAVGEVNIPDSVISLERGAFSGCDEMVSINLHNVNIIGKSCFTNCTSLKSLYCSDLITYIGEWAFAYCSSLKTVSIQEKTIIDNNAFSNTNAKVKIRKYFSNYLIESENLYTLKSMQARYMGKIDSILIDPPYNSNIDYIRYKDSNFEEGYINFLSKRLILSKELLSKTGFLVINIDEGEVKNVFNLCKSLFGHDLVTLHKWKKKHDYFDTNRVILNPLKKQTDYEYIIIARKSKNSKFRNIMQPYIYEGKILEKETKLPYIFDCFGTTSSAKDEIEDIFGKRDYFSTPKPLKLMKELIRATTNKNSIVLDYFAGSGTVGHALEDLNKEDGGSRKFILVSNSESNICKEVTLKRLEKASIDFTFLH